MIGKINSIETMGLVDGPGIRFVVFLQGCPNRCIFCHNPETWKINDGYEENSINLVNKILKYKNYFGENGGVTFSGGEPLMQPEFLLECLKLCKKNNINTCLDTSGIGSKLLKEILEYTDLVILDIKAIDKDNFNKIVNNNFDQFLTFLKLCQNMNKQLWLRQVIIPNVNDNKEYIESLYNFIKPIKNVSRVELLPFHNMADAKYKKLNIDNPLINKKSLDMIKYDKLQKYLSILMKKH